jgi:putative methionine-R-sulfoxide reductase with GAF domain
MFGSAQPDTPFPSRNDAAADPDLPGADSPAANGDRALEGRELDAALQLLVERAQYITGATGAALALADGEEMVCRASAGSSGPAVGAHLQVRSGLSGESISRKQLLRCDNAETDPRVNLETCRQLGIASIVVMPLLTNTGEVRGLFELFSDHAYAFEERDLIALERMVELTLTALDMAERRPRAVPASEPVAGLFPPVAAPHEIETGAKPSAMMPPVPVDEAPQEAEVTPPAMAELTSLETPEQAELAPKAEAALPQPKEPEILAPQGPLGPAQVHSALLEEPVHVPAAAVPEAMRRVQKCTSCGFPVSEGRTLCVDCENKRYERTESSEATSSEFVPAFLAYSPPPDESWLANHVNLLAVLVLVLSIVVAVVIFR